MLIIVSSSANLCLKIPNTQALQKVHLAGKRKWRASDSQSCRYGVTAALLCKGQWRGTPVVLLTKVEATFIRSAGQLSLSGLLYSCSHGLAEAKNPCRTSSFLELNVSVMLAQDWDTVCLAKVHTLCFNGRLQSVEGCRAECMYILSQSWVPPTNSHTYDTFLCQVCFLINNTVLKKGHNFRMLHLVSNWLAQRIWHLKWM